MREKEVGALTSGDVFFSRKKFLKKNFVQVLWKHSVQVPATTETIFNDMEFVRRVRYWPRTNGLITATDGDQLTR